MDNPLKKVLRNPFKKMPKTLQERYAPRYKIGKWSYGNLTVRAFESPVAMFELGAFCSVAGGVQVFLAGEHRYDRVTSFPLFAFWDKHRHLHGHPTSKGDVIIGNDVWIGAETIILSGVRIGDGAVIGTRSVVTRDIPPYAIAAGTPARVIKMRFDKKTVDRLLTIRWWEWDDERIDRAAPLLLNTDIEAFLRAAESGEL